MEKKRPPFGLFGIREDHLQASQSLDQRFVKNPTATYFFEIEGEAMTPLILPGDILIVDRSLSSSSGSIIVAIYDEELLCRRLVNDRRAWLLRAENPRFRDIILTDERELIMWGVVRASVHSHLKEKWKKS